MSHVAVILAGCGYLDGSEIHESVLCLLALAQAGHTYHCFAPDQEQQAVVNHITQEPTDEKRNCLIEAARIARGEISSLADLDPAKFNAVLIPGGFGAAQNLCSFASEGENCTVHPTLQKALLGFHAAKKPIGATCISPAILAKTFEGKNLKLTLGKGEANAALTAMGHEAHEATSCDAILDDTHKIYTTPCYMNPPDLAGMFEGVKKVVSKL